MVKEFKSLKQNNLKKKSKKLKRQARVKHKKSKLKFRLYRNKQFVKFS